MLAGFLSLIPLLCGALWMIYPSVVCVGFSAVLLSTLVLFRGAALRAEIIRRGHLQNTAAGGAIKAKRLPFRGSAAEAANTEIFYT